MSRPLLVALIGVLLLMVVSWTVGEWLRQRPRNTKDTKNTKNTKSR